MKCRSLINSCYVFSFVALCVAYPARATLVPHISDGKQVVYSTDQNLTLTKDANLYKTLLDSYDGAYPTLADEIIDRIGSIGGVALIPDDFEESIGVMRWYGAMAFVEWLNLENYAGSSNWRLWDADPTCGGRPADPDDHDCPAGELGFIYYIEGQLLTYDGWLAEPPGILPDYFDNLRENSIFWARNNDGTFTWAHWTISKNGRQIAYSHERTIPNFFFAWPVQSGELGSPVPEVFKDGFEEVQP